MVDVVDSATRSRMMSGIRGKNTKPEWLVRKGLHTLGFRYRLHVKELPGKPDIVLPKYRAAVFVHGCFWHGHCCPLFKWPSTRREFWRKKIEGNVTRDQRATQALIESGWRVATIWECGLRCKGGPEAAVEQLSAWLASGRVEMEFRG